MDDARAGAGEAADVVGRQRRAVDEHDVGSEHADSLEELDLGAVVALADPALLAHRHRVVLAEAEALAAGELDEPAQELLGAAAGGARAEPDPDLLGVAPRLRDRERVGDRLLRRLRQALRER